MQSHREFIQRTHVNQASNISQQYKSSQSQPFEQYVQVTASLKNQYSYIYQYSQPYKPFEQPDPICFCRSGLLGDAVGLVCMLGQNAVC